ncbi:MAG: GWxTD domain-containing protein [Balneolaceae bacterium]
MYSWTLGFGQPDIGQDVGMWLNRGLEAEASEAYEEALEIWREARAELNEPSLAIAVEYLRLATEQQMKRHYPMASSIYLWGLSGGEISEQHVPALEKELTRLEPLLEEEQVERWSAMFTERDPLLLGEIRGYWQSLNPVPGRSYNPRLLEHWERIAYARNHFTRSVDAPYGTDARGHYYVKYGEPDQIDEGVFPLLRHDVRRIIDDEEMEQTVINILYQRAHAPHRYEYWIYYSPAEEMAFNLILMFGDTGISGYKRIVTLNDFVPSSFYNTSEGRVAALTLLEIYYNHLAVQDSYFANRYQELKRRIDTSPDPSRSRAVLTSIRSQDVILNFRETQAAPTQISAEESSVPPIPVEVYQYRLLDEDGEPILLSFIESRPTTAVVLDQRESRLSDPDESLNHYRLTHGLQLSDEHRRPISRSRYRPDLFIDPFGDTPSSSVFTVPFISAETSQLFYAELENTDPTSPPRFESLIPDEIRGVGKRELMQPEPLPLDGSLLLGDLLMGYERRPEPVEGARFPFVVSNTGEIPEGENLVVHFELYNLEPDSSGISSFEVEYEIQSVRRFLFWDRIRSEGDLSITLSFQHDAPRFTESLEIQTQGLNPGEYELVWRARDLTSKEETIRNRRFEIVSSE